VPLWKGTEEKEGQEKFSKKTQNKKRQAEDTMLKVKKNRMGEMKKKVRTRKQKGKN
jgi:hypothetical protein